VTGKADLDMAGGRGRWPAIHPSRRGIGIGVGVTIVFYALTVAVHIPHGVVLAMGAGGLAMVVTPMIPWRAAIRRLHRRIGRGVQGLLENGRDEVASRACDRAADLLDGLLANHVDDLWTEAGRWSRHWAGRRLITDYHRRAKQDVLHALYKTWETETVPPRVMEYAQGPRNTSELQQLRNWLRARATTSVR
jgi:hypothetical protein